MKLSNTQIQAEIQLARNELNRGQAPAAMRRFARILASDPQCWEAHFGQGVAFVAGGMHSDALAAFEAAMRGSASNPDLLYWAAMSCLNLGRGDRAEGFARRLVSVQPRNAKGLFLLANALCAQDRLEEALDSVEGCLGLEPGAPDYVVAKAQLLGRLNWSSQAVEWYGKAIALRPSPILSIELANALLEEGRPKESVSVLRQVSSAPPEALAQAFTEMLDFDAAERHWIAAERSIHDRSALFLIRARSEIYAGRMKVAEQVLQTGIEIDSECGAMYQLLTSIRRVTEEDASLVQAMERIAESDAASPQVRREVGYALGKAYNDLGDHEHAILAYDEANRLAYELSPLCGGFSPDAWRAYTDLQIEVFSRERIEKLSEGALESELPLFIVGMIRSGTTLTEQILSRHSLIEAGGEKTFWADHRNDVLDPATRRFHAGAGRRLGQSYLRLLSGQGGGRRYVTEKNPANITIAGLIHCVLPRARIVHLKRSAVDNLLSIWMTPMQTGLPFVYSRENLVFAYRQYQRLVRHLADVLPCDLFRTFTYEAITSEPASTIPEMQRFLELEPELACLYPELNERVVRTPSFFQARQPINTKSQEKWRRYEPWLGVFDELIGK